MTPAKVSAVIVTRGDVNLDRIVGRLDAFDDLVVWDNSKERQDHGVYGRYVAIERCQFNTIYVQDDDCLINAEKIVERYEPGKIVANMPVGRWPDYPDSCLVGWGAVFDRDLPAQAFTRWFSGDWDSLADGGVEEFRLGCDIIFTTLTPHTVIDVGFEHLPWAEDPERAMFKRAQHQQLRQRMLELARLARDDESAAA